MQTRTVLAEILFLLLLPGPEADATPPCGQVALGQQCRVGVLYGGDPDWCAEKSPWNAVIGGIQEHP